MEFENVVNQGMAAVRLKTGGSARKRSIDFQTASRPCARFRPVPFIGQTITGDTCSGRLDQPRIISSSW